jgi:hypothetical protein
MRIVSAYHHRAPLRRLHNHTGPGHGLAPKFGQFRKITRALPHRDFDRQTSPTLYPAPAHNNHGRNMDGPHRTFCRSCGVAAALWDAKGAPLTCSRDPQHIFQCASSLTEQRRWHTLHTPSFCWPSPPYLSVAQPETNDKGGGAGHLQAGPHTIQTIDARGVAVHVAWEKNLKRERAAGALRHNTTCCT